MSADAGRIARLVALYAAQGIPFGFTTAFIPIQLAAQPGFTYSKATLLTLVLLPWLLKLVWAPAVDTHYFARLGRRRSWILPAQALIALTAFGASFLSLEGSLWPIVVALLLLNLFASVQDTAVDGLAVETLSPSERGLGNAAQVAGYKLGMVAAGSGLVLLASPERLGYRGAMQLLGGLVLLLMLAPLTYREPAPPARVATALHHHADKALQVLWRTLRQPGWGATLLFIATVKVGETAISNLMKPMLVKEFAFTPDQVATTLGIAGMIASLVGSVVGGVIAMRFARLRLLAVFGLLQAATLLVVALVLWWRLPNEVIAVTLVVEHFVVGLLTPVLFAYMMDVADPSIAATHYGLLALVEVSTKGFAGALAGLPADGLGAVPFTLVVALLSPLPLLLLGRVRRPISGGEAGASPATDSSHSDPKPAEA